MIEQTVSPHISTTESKRRVEESKIKEVQLPEAGEEDGPYTLTRKATIHARLLKIHVR